MKRLTFFALFTVSLLMLASARPGRQPTENDLMGRWVGFEQSFWEFYSLNLRPDHTGSLVVLNEGKPAVVYLVEWEITKVDLTPEERKLRDTTWPKSVLNLRTSVRSKGAESIALSAPQFDHRRIDLIIEGATNQWKHEVFLNKEKDLQVKIEASAKYESK